MENKQKNQDVEGELYPLEELLYFSYYSNKGFPKRTMHQQGMQRRLIQNNRISASYVLRRKEELQEVVSLTLKGASGSVTYNFTVTYGFPLMVSVEKHGELGNETIAYQKHINIYEKKILEVSDELLNSQSITDIFELRPMLDALMHVITINGNDQNPSLA